MTAAAITALRADHKAFGELAEEFTDEEWTTPSACEGWAVRDVLSHMTQLWRQVVDPGSLPPGDPSGKTERTQDRWVEALQDKPVAEVLADYRTLGDQAITALEGLQGVDTEMDLGDLGTHPMHRIANAFAFDHYTHIRVDVLAPRGPLDHPAPPVEDAHLEATVDWILGGLPQMSPAVNEEPIDLVLTGPGGRTARVGPEEGEALATITSSVPDVVLWITGRADHRDLDVKVEGDEEAADRFFASAHVF
jgi:uncharacterized protein (TIGR03083 family)